MCYIPSICGLNEIRPGVHVTYNSTVSKFEMLSTCNKRSMMVTIAMVSKLIRHIRATTRPPNEVPSCWHVQCPDGGMRHQTKCALEVYRHIAICVVGAKCRVVQAPVMGAARGPCSTPETEAFLSYGGNQYIDSDWLRISRHR